jgi:hypothetical protein
MILFLNKKLDKKNTNFDQHQIYRLASSKISFSQKKNQKHPIFLSSYDLEKCYTYDQDNPF